MNVYDFDNTIYDGDSTIDFYLFCVMKHPKVLFCLPGQIYGFLLYKLKKVEKTRFKEMFFSFLKKLPNANKEVEEFWSHKQYKIKEWYLKIQEENDVIISASPEFLLREICNRIGIKNLIASDVDINSGLFYKENCYGEKKVDFFWQRYPNAKIDNFYSDSLSDGPLAKLAKKAYIVSKDDVHQWLFKEGK